MFSPHLRRQSRRSVRLEPSYRRATPPLASIRSRLTAPAVRVGSERRGYVLILEGSSERSLAEKTKSDDMPPTRGNVVAILSNSGKANPRAFAEERLGVLASNHKSAGNDAAALRCEITVPEGSHGGGCDHPTPTLITLSQKPAPRPFKPRGTNNQPLPVPTRSVVVEAPDAVTLRQRTVKTTSFGTAGMHCAAVSLLKRTARLSDILRHMGHGNSGQDPDWVPPSDAEILAAYYRRMMAKQRWTKAQAALTSIRAMQGGLLGALGGGAAQKAKAFPAFGAIPGAEPKPPPPPPPPPRPVTPEDPDSPRSHTPTPFVVVKPRRASITELTSGARAKAQASAMMGRMPKEKDVRRMLRELAGDWFVVFVDTKFDMILAAMSGECTSEVFAAVGGDGTLYFGTDRASMPSDDDDAEVVQFPRSTYFCGRCAQSSSLVFKRFTARLSSSVETTPSTTPLTTPERSLPVSPEPPEEEVVSLSLEDGAGAGPVVEGKAPPPTVVAKPETGTSSA